MRKQWPRGSYNHWVILLGVNGCGKTTRAKEIAMSHAKEGVRVFISDPDGQFAPWPKYESIEAWKKAEKLARTTHTNFPLIARFEKPEPSEVLALGKDSAARSGFSVPSIVIVDEGSGLYGKARRNKFDQELLAMVTRRRNQMTGVVLCYQWASMLHYLCVANATEIHLMRLEDDHQTRYLERFIPDPVTLTDGRQVSREEMLAKLPSLQRGECYAVRKGF